MRVMRRSILAGAGVVALAGTGIALRGADSAFATAIGGGWTEYTPPQYLQIESHGKIAGYPASTTHQTGPGGSYDRAGGVESFKLFNHDASNRVEKRIRNDYTSGQRQFEGEVRVSPPTNNESVMQIFGRVGGASMLMIRAYAAGGGTLRAMGMHATVATGIYGQWVHLNIIHDATANNVSIYVGGQQIGTWKTPTGTHYFKYGVYGTLRTSTAQVDWRNVHFYQK